MFAVIRRNSIRKQLLSISEKYGFLGLMGVVTCLVMIISTGTVSAQGKSVSKKGAVVDKTLQAADGWPIAVTYYESTLGPDAPAVILLHMRGGNRLVWKGGLADQLQQQGFAVVAVDLRGHGDSRPDTAGGAKPGRKRKANFTAADYQAMWRLDLEAVKKFLLEEHHKKKLNVRKTAIVAPEFSAPLAIKFAMYDWLKPPYDDAPVPAARTPRGQDIRALVLLSPMETLPGVVPGRDVINLAHPSRGVYFMLLYGSQDGFDRGRAARNIIQKMLAFRANKKRVYEGAYKTKLRGTDMLGKVPKIETRIIGFLKKYVKELPDEWRDRRSRLER